MSATGAVAASNFMVAVFAVDPFRIRAYRQRPAPGPILTLHKTYAAGENGSIAVNGESARPD
jgi:hypothetical protein